MMYTRLTIFVLLCIGCTSKSDRKAVDFEQIRPKTKYTLDSSVVHESPQSDAKWAFNHERVQLGVERVDTLTTGHFLDRFSAISFRDCKILTSKNGQLTYRRWEFPDSNRRKNAQYNWWDNFGEDKISLTWFSSTKISKEATLILFNARSIIEIQGQKNIETSKWIEYQKTFYPKDSICYLLVQALGSKCQWYKRTSSNTIELCKP